MGYIEDILISDEHVVYRARVHWAILLPGIILIPVVIGLVHLAIAAVTRATTEMAVTNKRAVLKTGWLNRATFEIRLDRIENVHVRQTAFARFLGYGTIFISGTGGTYRAVGYVADPHRFHRALHEQMERATRARD